MPVSKNPRVLFESTPEGTHLRKASQKKETSAMTLGVFVPSDIVERVEGWRPKASGE